MGNTRARISGLSLSLVILLIPLLLSGCGFKVISGSGQVISESRPVSDFNAVTLTGRGDLFISQGETESLKIEAEDNLLPYIKSEVKNGTLVIGFDKENWKEVLRPTKPIKFTVTLKDITALTLTGLGSIQSTNLTADQLVVKVSGSGDVRIDQLDANELTYDLSGSGDAVFSGQVDRQEITISGSGSYNGGDLNSQAAKVTISGSGDVTLWAEDSLEVSTSGSGSVSYYGSPQVTTSSSGSGKLQSLGEK
jgi:hypothetical protein